MAALETFLAAAKNGDSAAAEQGSQMCGDLWLYWHIRGRNITAREYAVSFLEADPRGVPSIGRAGALITAGLASDMLGQMERANDEWGEAYRIAAECAADRELCISAFCQSIALIGLDLEAGLERTSESVERSRAVGFTWAEGFAASLDGILRTVAGDLETAQTSLSEALAIQRRLGDEEGAGLSLGGLAGLAALRGDLPRASTSTASRLPPSRRSATGPRKRGSSRKLPGHTYGTTTRRSRGGTSSPRRRRTTTWRASAASGSR
jgi:non-specific serine/threonine protein kinase